tara:strand:+ start:495 stop:2756 length:2262 start_codon:yes stop_codon:yes gene_type:complete
MDKTLNRPLFKKRAQEIHQQVNPKQVPKFFLGGIMQAGNMIRAGAAPVYRYLAPKVSSFMNKPAVQTGIVGLEGYGIGVGSQDMAEGVAEGDTGKFLQGAALAVPGAAFLPSSAKRSGIQALRETGEYLSPRMTDVAQALVRNPGKTAIGSIGTGITGAYLSPDAIAQAKPAEMSNEDYAKDIQERLIYKEKPEYKPDPKKKVTENLKEYKESTKDFTPYVIGIENPLTEGEKALDAQLKTVAKVKEVANKLGVDPIEATDEQLKQISIESNVDLSTLKTMVGQKDEGAATADNMPSPNNDGVPNITGNEGQAETQYLIDKRKRDVAGGKEISDSGTLAGQFAEFKTKLNEITGTSNDNLNNLLMMRVAGQLLSGKSPEKGIRGFLDIVGQTMGSTADAMIGLKLKQQDSDMKLAQAFLKMKADKAKDTGMLTGGDKTVRVSDPSVPGGFRNVRVSLGKDNKFYERVLNPDGTQGFVQATFTGTDVKRNDEKLNKALMGLEDNRRGGKMVEFVIKNASEGGTKAALGLLTEDAFGTFDFFAGGNVGGDSSVIDDQIRAEMAQTPGREGLDFSGGKVNIFAKESENMTKRFNSDLEDARENGAERVEKQLKKAGIIAKNYRPTEDELRNYTRLALIEQRMKYIVANANKSEDRLTQKDIDNAAKRTQIIKYITSPRTIRLNYEQLREEFAEKAGSYLTQYKLNGGDELFIQENFMDIPGVALQYQRKNKEFMRNQNVTNKKTRQDILNTIPIGG